MPPTIPTFRPWITPTRVAAAIAIVSVVSSLTILFTAPAVADTPAAAIACAAHGVTLR